MVQEALDISPPNGAPTGAGQTGPHAASLASARLEVEQARRGTDRDRHVDALMRLGRLLARAGHWVEAAAAFEAAATLAEDPTSLPRRAQALANAGAALFQGDQPDEALLVSYQAKEAFEALGDVAAQRQLWTNCAVIHRHLAQPQPARLAAQQAEALFPAGAADPDLIDMHVLQAELATEAGELALAQTHAEAALRGARELGDGALIGQQLEQLSALVLETQGPAAALPRCFETFTHYRQLGDEPGEYRATLQLALVYQHLGRWPDSLAALTDAQKRVRQHGSNRDTPMLAASLAASHVAMGQFPAAARQAQAAVAGYRAVGDGLGLGRALVTLGQCVEAAGDPRTAKTLWREALTLLDCVDPEGADAARQLLGSG